MSTETYQEKTIQGLKFQLSMLPATAALECFHGLVRVCGPGLPSLVSAIAAGGIANMSQEKLFGVGGSVFAALAKAPTPEVMALAKQLLQPCRVQQDGKWAELPGVYDVVLQGKVWAQLNLLLWAIQFNFSDFFDGMKNAAAARQGDAAKVPSST